MSARMNWSLIFPPTMSGYRIVLYVSIFTSVAFACLAQMPEVAASPRALAEQGDVEAQYSLARDYYNGSRDIKRDSAEAARWFRAAADQGHSSAQKYLGMLYRQGQGVEKDSAEAFRWIRAAADQGDGEAQFWLADMYSKGEGVLQDYVKAASLARQYGNNRQAIRWYRAADVTSLRAYADRGDGYAQHYLGEAYRNGRGVEQDNVEAIRWYHMAAEQGILESQLDLAVMYRNGIGVKQDDAKATSWLTAAAEQGDTETQYKLGVMFRDGQRVAQDDVMAARWLRAAAEQGDAKACYDLALMYLDGQGVEQNYDEALRWARLGDKETERLAVHAARSDYQRKLSMAFCPHCTFEPPTMLPRYRWPPEEASWLIRLDQDINEGLREGMSLYDVGDLLWLALRDAEYLEAKFYWAPGGFVMVTRFEAIDADGMPLKDEQRYILPSDKQPDFLEHLRSLFFATEGYYRFIAFVITDAPYVTTAEDLLEAEAQERMRRGAAGLPGQYRKRPFSKDHRIEALIYEFRKESQVDELAILLPGRISPQAHFENSGLPLSVSVSP